MKTTAFVLSTFAGSALAFTNAPSVSQATASSTIIFAYIPDGLSAEQWNKIKKQEATKYNGIDLGRLGPRGFKSRSMEAWQKAYERGEADHAFAPFNFQEKLRKGLITKSDVPYMVRGGSWDNSDVFGAKRLKWLREDKDYAAGGFKKQQSASLLGSGPGFDWAGKRTRDENLQNRVVPGLS
jgi:hypothetical protein